MTEAPILATCWLTAGDAAPLRGDESSAFLLRDRVEAAAAAGFSGFGVAYPDLVPAIERYGIGGIRQMLQENGFDYLELEFIGNWWASGEARVQSDIVRRRLLSAAAELGARHIKVGVDMNDGPWDFDHWVEEFALLTDQASAAGTKIALEPMPFANLKTVDDALSVVEAAGNDAGGLLIDSWHVARAGTPFERLATLPANRIFGVELVDADAEYTGGLWEDTITNRRFCGRGDLDLHSFIANLQTAGWSGAWGVEIVSDEIRAMSLVEAVTTAFQTTRAQFEPQTS